MEYGVVLFPRPARRTRYCYYSYTVYGIGLAAGIRITCVPLGAACPVAPRVRTGGRIGKCVTAHVVACTTLSGGSLGSCVDEERS